MKKWMVTLLIGIVSAVSAAEITLAENGQAKAGIVIPEKAKPIVRFAAQELAEHLKKMTGADFRIGSKPSAGVNFYLGFGQADKFNPDEYVIDAKGKRIDIYGKDTPKRVFMFDYFYDNPDKGTLSGVYSFLDSLGVRWLAPGKDGVYVPVRKTLRIPEGRVQYKPDLPDRQIANGWDFTRVHPDAGEYVGNVNELYRWGLRNHSSTRNMVSGCHSERSLGLFKNPEWLKHTSAHQQLKDGRRNANYSCWTDPYTKEVWLRAVDGYFSGKGPKECGFNINGYLHSKWPNPFITPNEFMIDPMDHGGGNDGRCWCARCEDFRKKHPCKDDTEIIWQVIGEIADHVAKKYPGCYISTLVYPPKRLIPQTIRKPKNIRVRICMPGARLLLHPDKLEKDIGLLTDWGEFLGPKNIPLWVYQCNASFGNFMPGIPDSYPHLTAKFIRKVRPLSAGMFCENHNLTHTYRNLDVYIFMRLMWNPDLDVEKELDDYFRFYYGPAAAPAKEFFARLENNWAEIDRLVFGDPKKSASLGLAGKDKDTAQKLAWGKVYTSDEMKKLEALLRKMEQLSSADPAYAKRVGLLRKYLFQIMKTERSIVMDKEDKRKDLKLPVLFSSAETFPSDEEWSKAKEYQLISAQRLDPKLQAGGSFRMLASDDLLFIRADLKEPNMAGSATVRTRKSGNVDIWMDNCVELFFYTEKTKKFWQIIVNDNNAWSSQTRGRVLARWVQMKGLKVKTQRKADGWTADITIPLKELKTDKTDLRFNFTRERNVKGLKTEFSTWSPLAMLGNWHSADNYGNLTFQR